MRVVAGSAKGRRLAAPPGRDTRPTADRVREAVFNALWSMGVLRDATVVDLFAGSGALGIEALSRGARACTFVERSRAASDVVRANLAATNLAERATVIASDALAWCRTTTERFDVAFADPPYAFDAWDELLAVVPAPFVVAESDRAIVPPPGWATLRERRYGTTVTTFLAAGASAPPPGPPEGNE